MIVIEPGFTLLYQAIVGSQAYGMATPESDTDRMGVVLQPLERVVGHQGFEQYMDDKNPEGQTTLYALDKWVKLVLKGNPTVTELLWAPAEHTSLVFDDHILSWRKWMVSKRTIKGHLGYLTAQRQRMKADPNNHHGRGNPRSALVEKYGYDTKFAAHAVRLGMMGCTMAYEGHYELPLHSYHRDVLLSIRRGEKTELEVNQMIDSYIAALEQALEKSQLPDDPNYQFMDEQLRKIYLKVWNEQSH